MKEANIQVKETNIQVKEMKIDMGTFFFPFFMPFSNVFVVGIGRMKHIMEDETLGAFELHSFI